MSLSYALLALLTDCPRSGYDLSKSFEESIGFFWKASHQQIYRELARLEVLGWVAVNLVHQTGKPDKKVYHVTELGQAELTVWVAQPADISPIKEEILVKLFVGKLVQPQVLQHHLERLRQHHENLLAKYEQIAAIEFCDRQLAPEAHLQYLTLRCGIRYSTSWISWCDEVLDYLKTIIPDTQLIE